MSDAKNSFLWDAMVAGIVLILALVYIVHLIRLGDFGIRLWLVLIASGAMVASVFRDSNQRKKDT
jgi:hypothetical protein